MPVMILTTLQDANAHLGAHPMLGLALDFLRSLRGNESPGRIDLKGEQAFALLQTYGTKAWDADTKLEAHRRYTDLQFILRGRETLLWCPLHRLGQPCQPHDPQRDFALWKAAGSPSTPCKMNEGFIAVLGPCDAHAPALNWGETSEEVFKVVIKLECQG
jgi:biofilm protein TabA